MKRLTDADLARWKAKSDMVLKEYGSQGAEDDDEIIVALIAEVRRLRALVMGPPTTRFCPKCGKPNPLFVEPAR